MMKILNVSNSLLAGAPVSLSSCLNKYSNGLVESKCLCLRKFRNPKLSGLSWEYDYIGDDSKIIKDMIDTAEVIIHHQRPFLSQIPNKKQILMFHAEPNGYVPNKTHKDFKNKLVICNYHADFYLDATIVPNLTDIWQEDHLPGKKDPHIVKIFYSYANEVPGTPADKGSKQTLEILERIKSRVPVVVEFVTNTPFKEVMKRKQSAHIIIDEVVTGACHKQSQEGLSVGALTINNISDSVKNHIMRLTGAPDVPYVKTDIENLENVLMSYILNPDALQNRMKKSREWVEQYFDPKILVRKYLDFFSQL